MNNCHYCNDKDCPELDWIYGLDHILPNYKFCPMCGRRIDSAGNAPLTLEELREMDGEPVWVQEIEKPKRGQWRIIKKPWYDVGLCLDSCGMLECEDMGKTWLAYRRKPELLEGKKC